MLRYKKETGIMSSMNSSNILKKSDSCKFFQSIRGTQIGMHTDMIKQISHEHDFDGIDHANEKEHWQWCAHCCHILRWNHCRDIDWINGSFGRRLAHGNPCFGLGYRLFCICNGALNFQVHQVWFGTGKFGALVGLYQCHLSWRAWAFTWLSSLAGAFWFLLRIAFDEAILVAIGLIVNALSIWMLHTKDTEHHSHDHQHDHNHERHHDHNLRTAYLHVVTDALTSVPVWCGSCIREAFRLVFPRPNHGRGRRCFNSQMGGGLLRSSSLILLDGDENKDIRNTVIESIESDGDSVVSDLPHLASQFERSGSRNHLSSEGKPKSTRLLFPAFTHRQDETHDHWGS